MKKLILAIVAIILCTAAMAPTAAQSTEPAQPVQETVNTPSESGSGGGGGVATPGVTFTLQGGEKKQVSLGGQHEVWLVGVVSPTLTVVSVDADKDGTTMTLTKGLTYTMSGLGVRVEDVFYLSSTDQAQNSAKLSLWVVALPAEVLLPAEQPPSRVVMPGTVVPCVEFTVRATEDTWLSEVEVDINEGNPTNAVPVLMDSFGAAVGFPERLSDKKFVLRAYSNVFIPAGEEEDVYVALLLSKEQTTGTFTFTVTKVTVDWYTDLPLKAPIKGNPMTVGAPYTAGSWSVWGLGNQEIRLRGDRQKICELRLYTGKGEGFALLNTVFGIRLIRPASTSPSPEPSEPQPTAWPSMYVGSPVLRVDGMQDWKCQREFVSDGGVRIISFRTNTRLKSLDTRFLELMAYLSEFKEGDEVEINPLPQLWTVLGMESGELVLMDGFSNPVPPIRTKVRVPPITLWTEVTPLFFPEVNLVNLRIKNAIPSGWHKVEYSHDLRIWELVDYFAGPKGDSEVVEFPMISFPVPGVPEFYRVVY